MKGFIVQYIAHGEKRLFLLAARHEQRLKVCVCVCCSDRVQIKRLLTLDEEQPLDGNWLTKCSSRCIQITVFNFTVPLAHSVPLLVSVHTTGAFTKT